MVVDDLIRGRVLFNNEELDDLIIEQSEWTGNYMDNHVNNAVKWSKSQQGVEFIKLSKAEKAKWDAKLAFLNDKWVKGAKEKGLPAQNIVDYISMLIKKYAM